MELFADLITPNDKVVEVGGHIGFITTYFAQLVSAAGSVTVLEPGLNNIPYIEKNIEIASKLSELGKIKLEVKAVGPEVGEIDFYEDTLSGQNNSVVANYVGLESNAKAAFSTVETNKRTVQLVSLDSYLGDDQVDFVKIDAEEFELGVLKGMEFLLQNQRPMIMVEVTSSQGEILDLLNENGYDMFDDNRNLISTAREMGGSLNFFCLHKVAHKEQLRRYF